MALMSGHLKGQPMAALKEALKDRMMALLLERQLGQMR
jgi:hypothetical protein